MAQALAFFVLSTIVSGAISFLFPSEGPRLKDLTIAASTYGNIIPTIWGTCRVGGNMIWAKPIAEVKTKQKAGLGSFTNSYTYFGNFAMAFCQGPAQALRKVWANGKLIYDTTGDSPHATTDKYKIRVYYGTEDQLADPLVADAVGADNCPAYRGLMYAVFEDFALADFGNALPQFAAEVYCGDNNVIPFTTIVADTTSTISYNNGEVYDADRGYFWTLGYDSTKGKHGLHRYNINTGVEDLWGFPDFTIMELAGISNPDLTSILGVFGDGSVICEFGGDSGDAPLCIIDPDSLNVTSFLRNVASPMAIDIGCVDITGQTLVIISGYYGNAAFVDYRTGRVVSNGLDASIASVNILNGGYGLCAGDGTAIWYFVWNIINLDSSGTQEFYIEKITGNIGGTPIVERMGTFTPAQTGPGVLVTNKCVWDNGQPGVIIQYSFSDGDPNGQYGMLKWSPDTNSIIWDTRTSGAVLPTTYAATPIYNGEISWIYNFGSTRLYIINTSDGSFVDRIPDQNFYLPGWEQSDADLSSSNPGVAGYPISANFNDDHQIYDGTRGIVLAGYGPGNADLHAATIGGYATVSATLEGIVESLLRTSGLTGPDFNLTQIEGTAVRGFGIASNTDVKGVLDTLCQIFLFDLVEIDGKLVAVLRGANSSVETISYLALGNSAGDNPDQVTYWTETRASEADLPAQVALVYLNIDLDLQTSTAKSNRISSPRPTMYSKQEVQFEANIIFNATEAKIRTAAMLYVQWAERSKHKTKLPLAYTYLDPCDLITVNLPDSREYTERITQTELGADFSLDTETVGQDSGAYTQDVVGDSGGSSDFPPVVISPTLAKLFVFNTPYLRDVDVGQDGILSIYYIGAGNTIAGTFGGAGLYQSLDNSDFTLIDVAGQGIEWAAILGAPVPAPSHGAGALDWGTTINLRSPVTGFALESCTDAVLAEYGNMFIIGDEVMQFRDAIQNADGTWTISNLLRGRRGTEWACDTHGPGETFAFLDANTVDIEQESLDMKDKDLWFKAVGVGKSVEGTLSKMITYEPRDLMPYAPVQLSAAWSTADIVISFERRTRYNGNMMDGTGAVPLNEVNEAYEADIYAVDGVTILRTISINNGPTPVTNPSITYTAVEIATDWASLPSTIDIDLYQIGIVGRGFGSRETLTVTGAAAQTTRYWGASSLTSLTGSQVQALGNSDLVANYNLTTSYDCTGGKYPYFAFPAAYGTPAAVIVNSLPFSSFTVTTETVGGVSYHVLRFINLQHGAAIPVIWA